MSFNALIKADSTLRASLPLSPLPFNLDTQEVRKFVDSTMKCYRIGQFESAMKYVKLISIISEKINYSEGKALAARWTGSIYREQGELNLAKEHFKKALKLYEEINNYKGIVKLNNILGDYYYNMSDFTISLEHYIKALNINEFKKDMDGLSISYNNIGRIYYSQENYDMALRYYAKSIEIKKAFHHKASLANTYNNVARTYLKMLRYDSAYYYFDQAWIIYNLTGEKVGEADSHMSIGNVQYETGDYLSAIISQNKALSIYETNGDLLRIAICQLALGKAFFKLHDLKKAETYFNKALAGSIKYKLKKTAMEVYLNLAHLKDAEAEYKLALGYYKLYSEMKDSIFKEETRNKIIEINERYENTKKDKAIAELNQEKSRIIAENNLKTIERENRTKILFTIMLSLSIMLLIFYRFLNIKQQKERQKEFTMQLIESQEDERKRISKDLHDGIGQNLLVIKNSCKEQLPLIESTIEDLRNISRNMHPVQLEKLGFIKATESVIVEAKQNSTILFTYELDDVDAMLTPSRKINLFRIIQECISNIIKHSGTSAAKISVLISKNNIVTSIYDKGKGFDIKETKKRKSLGLTSIAERVELMDGKLNISSNSKGTRIEIILKHA